MNIKGIFSKSAFYQRGMHRCIGLVFISVLATGSFLVTSCGRKSQAQEDEANLKLVGYDLDQIGFFKAVGNDDVQALKIFKELKFDLNQKDLKGCSVAYVAAESGSVRALHFLVKNGADILAADQGGVSPLMAAARAGKAENGEAISYLLEKGADARRKDKTGKFALIHAMDGKSAEAIHLLAPHSRQMLDTGLLYAANMDQHETIPVLVKYGASVYARNGGKTSLMIAAERGNDRAAKALIAVGANLYAVSDDGKLAKDFAEGDERVLAVLLESETDAKTDPLALDWSEDELEELVQKAMDRSRLITVAGADIVDVANPVPKPKQKVMLQRIKGKKLTLELADSVAVEKQVTMAAYAEKTLPIKVKADDTGRVEIYELRASKGEQEAKRAVQEGSKIGMTGLRVKQIKKKVVNNKLTGGQDKDMVTLLIEDDKTGQLKEL